MPAGRKMIWIPFKFTSVWKSSLQMTCAFWEGTRLQLLTWGKPFYATSVWHLTNDLQQAVRPDKRFQWQSDMDSEVSTVIASECYHCGNSIEERSFEYDDKQFCCIGCQGV